MNGNSCLHLACANGHKDVVEYLIKLENIKFLPNKSGNTPLHWALQMKQKDIAEILLNHEREWQKNKKQKCVDTDESKKNSCDENSKNRNEIDFNLNAESHKKVKSKVTETQLDTSNVIPTETRHDDNFERENNKSNETRCIDANKIDNKKSLNILSRNALGKSALSEGFCLDDEKIISLMVNLDEIDSLNDDVHQAEEIEEDLPIIKKKERQLNFLRTNCELQGTSSDKVPPNQKFIQDTDCDIQSSNNRDSAIEFRSNTEEIVRELDDYRSIISEVPTSSVSKNLAADNERVKSKKQAKNRITAEVYHEFVVRTSKKTNESEEKKISLLCREISIENEFLELSGNESESYDSTGVVIWTSSLVLTRWLFNLFFENVFLSKEIIEIGSGCGLSGLCIAKSSVEFKEHAVRRMIFSDNFDFALHNCVFNCHLNNLNVHDSQDKILLRDCVLHLQPKISQRSQGLTRLDENVPNKSKLVDVNPNNIYDKSGKLYCENDPMVNTQDSIDKNSDLNSFCHIAKFDWNNSGDSLIMKDSNNSSKEITKFDVIIGSDLIYDYHMKDQIAEFIGRFLKKDGMFLYSHRHQRLGAKEFKNCLENAGMIVDEFYAPDKYYDNILKNKSQEHFNKIFNEAINKDVLLLRARW